MRFHPHFVLRLALLLDASVSLIFALGLLAAADSLASWLGLSELFLRGVGGVLLAYGLGLFLVLRYPRLGWVKAAIAFNLLWVADSLVLLLSGWVEPTALGEGLVLAQTVAVAGVMLVQAYGLRLSPQRA